MKTVETHANILVNIHDNILELEINRPEKKNALTSAMYDALTEQLKWADQHSEITVVYLHGQKNLFTSGNDLAEFINPTKDAASSAFTFLKTIASLQKILVCAVGGQAIGIGTTLLLHSDLAIAADDAKFQLPFVNLGLCPEGASSLILPNISGHKLANELLLLGESFTSEVAQKAGILNRIYPQDELLHQGLHLCKTLASKPYASLLTSKKLLKQQQQSLVLQTIDQEVAEFQHLLLQPAAKEILQAFIEKRPPNTATFKAHYPH
jgi:enoyl-CoA hydratase/carnithine racemase